MEERERDANQVDEYPQEIEYVMAERPMHQGTAGLSVDYFRVGGHGSAQKSRSQVDRYAWEPDHEHAEKYALQVQQSTS